jgi:hypothetical protein
VGDDEGLVPLETHTAEHPVHGLVPLVRGECSPQIEAEAAVGAGFLDAALGSDGRHDPASHRACGPSCGVGSCHGKPQELARGF